MNNDAFADMAEEAENVNQIEAGDKCPENCDKEVHELSHPRNSQLGAERHTDAPETEIVCVTHGIVAQR